MCKLDDFIEGKYDPNAPFNQPDNEHDLSITDLILNNDFDEAVEKANELREELIRLRKLLPADLTILHKKLKAIIEKI